MTRAPHAAVHIAHPAHECLGLDASPSGSHFEQITLLHESPPPRQKHIQVRTERARSSQFAPREAVILAKRDATLRTIKLKNRFVSLTQSRAHAPGVIVRVDYDPQPANPQNGWH